MSGALEQWWRALRDGFAHGAPLHLEAMVVVLVIAAAVALSVPRATWRWFGLYVTFVHELGHALAALLTGRVVRGIRLRLDHSGEMVSQGRGTASAVWAGFWGYPAPAVAGALMVWSAASGWGGAALSIGAVALLVSILFIRNGFGMLLAVVCAAVAQGLVVFLPRQAVGVVVLVLGISLLVGAVRDWFKVASVHRRRGDRRSSDAYLLSRMSGVPSLAWLAGFAVVIGACSFWALTVLGRVVG
ncbi:M50 family metallopeptidase [Zafaria sp. Z1313]|uniref:M50 family metallopeptidase n=1 Tax=unclassified Zafaria TaxID=2828765 RepID=UPI002E76BF1F|nr:M50 family metallopeptidase [Zafaria sp. J156]MEE1622306.1 M50 family metallopeptidase [Zafaria sp. J156]